MKQDKVANIILTAVNAVLAVVCVILYLGADRTEPKFIIQPAEVTYRPDMEEALLYEGIAAHDDRDGEITDKIVIEKKIENEAEGTVIVYYAVSDSAGNVTKFSKLFPAEYPVKVPAAVSEAGGGEQVVRQLEMDQPASGGMTADENDGDGAAGAEVEDGTGEDSGEAEDTEPDGEDAGEDDALDGEDEESDEEADDDHADASDHSNEDAQRAPEAAQPARNTGAPELVFSSTEVTINAGANVPWTEIISTLRDDKDDYATLYYNLQVSQYNRSRPGTYPVTVYTEDSDGNRSQTVPVTITVR